MSFYPVYKTYEQYSIEDFFLTITDSHVHKVLQKESLDEWDYLTLLSPTAANHLETIAQKANQVTVQYFGKTIGLYTPIYLSDHCVNQCSYCSFNSKHTFRRNRLTMEQVEQEAKIIAATGLKHILVLTGESRKVSPVSYIQEAVQVLKRYFSSISIEIYPLELVEYQSLCKSGVDGLTIYQEVYDEAIYKEVHVAGPKKDYLYRLDAPERGCISGMRTVNIGALLGLGDFYKQAWATGLHAQYLQQKYADVEIGVSLPRMRPHIGSFQPHSIVDDRQMVQMLMALRLFIPRIGINISTREQSQFRDSILPLGVTRMSAGVSTKVGGHSGQEDTSEQFAISDTRSVDEMMRMIYQRNYQPVLKDWHLI
ncbi:thiamine biosynthesis protein ThiH [Desulfuribacillus stibiiarsenatis]|uniref:Thiamine biosynthesis protein ThiH n=1 Tax=Desulfuribacillus stibiiarsenatis TaxID=1390249 RepID=A0A1E5L7T9_9FIRM|nr:2-iminoacetate synthase ThiH [Desulfuribacillus stibiiarsenatis]OEH86201.1 thiamine biosynthesis protein ThiH [Desulfuribacillus stibiiarsenatis]